MAKSVDDGGRGARLARRDEGNILAGYVTEPQRSRDAAAAKAIDLAIPGPLVRSLGRYLSEQLSHPSVGELFLHGVLA
jgi:hypothetical protein